MISETQRKYVFQVEKLSNKLEIKKAVEDRFNVIVDKPITTSFNETKTLLQLAIKKKLLLSVLLGI